METDAQRELREAILTIHRLRAGRDRLRAALERIARDDGRGPLSMRNEARRALNHD